MSYKTLSASILLTTTLTGCSFFDDIMRKGAEASDEVLRDALWTICKAVPVGAVKRRFNTESQVKAYDDICAEQEKLPNPPL